jgi:hypothetical protein
MVRRTRYSELRGGLISSGSGFASFIIFSCCSVVMRTRDWSDAFSGWLNCARWRSHKTIPQISFGSWFFPNPGMPVIEMPLAIMKYSSPSDHFWESPVNFGIWGGEVCFEPIFAAAVQTMATGAVFLEIILSGF